MNSFNDFKKMINNLNEDNLSELCEQFLFDHEGAMITLCKYCNESGYKGRLGIFEILTLSEESRELIINKASSEKIRDAATRNGMKIMLEDGIDKLIQGLTTIEEIVRVLDV